MHYVCQCVRSFWTTKPLRMSFNPCSASGQAVGPEDCRSLPPDPFYLLKNPDFAFGSLISACNGFGNMTFTVLLNVFLERKAFSYLLSYTSNISD